MSASPLITKAILIYLKFTFLPDPPAKIFFALICSTYESWKELLLELLVAIISSESFRFLFFSYFHSLFRYLYAFWSGTDPIKTSGAKILCLFTLWKGIPMTPKDGFLFVDIPMSTVTSSRLPSMNPFVQSIGSIQRQHYVIFYWAWIYIWGSRKSYFSLE